MEPTPSLSWRYRLVRAVVRQILRFGFSFGSQPAAIEGRQHLTAALSSGQPLILAGNHTGLLDGPMLMTALTRPVRFWVHQSVFSWPLVGRVVQWLEMIPVVPGRARESLRLGLERLRAGEVLAIFPEGKLTEDGTMDRFQRGVVLMQRKAEALILPFAIHGGFEAWPHGAHWPRFQPVKLVFGQPIPPHSACDEGTLLLLERQVSALRQGG